MAKFKFQISVSADGFIAGPNQSEDNALGDGGEQLHEWGFKLAVWREPHGREGGEVNTSTPVMEKVFAGIGAGVMGRNMFGGGPGPWGEEPWEGWWGDDPPFDYPVFVLTHHERPPLVKGGTTFTFVTDGIESALEQAKEAAGGKDVSLGGGADAAQQYLAAGLLDEVTLNVVPILLGSGTRLFDNLDGADVRFEQVRAIDAPGVAHLEYRVLR